MAITPGNSIGSTGSGQGGGSTQGPPGPANVLTVGTVETLPAGSDATVEITGESPKQIVNFGIPQGAAGGGGSGLGVPETWDAPGSFIIGYYDVTKGEEYHNPGDLVAASTIRVGQIAFTTKTDGVTSAPGWVKRPSGGTWRMHGSTTGWDDDDEFTALRCVLIFQRVDGLISDATLTAERMVTSVQNCVYSSEDNSTIDCEIYHNAVWIPFTASADDVSAFCQKVFADASSGKYGDIAPYAGSDE